MPIPENRRYTIEEFLTIAEQSDKRMELINGEIVALAAPNQIHQLLVGRLFSKIDGYIQSNKGNCTPLLAPFDVVLGEDLVQPDVFVVCDPDKLDGKRCNGAPDWVIEITSSNSRTDYYDKLELYKKNGVREYWIVNPDTGRVFVYFFEQSRNSVTFYNFTESIPVGIYQDTPVQLAICIAELM
ncbi:MAG: Uma2 family endonuclease [Oscillospiraceae bacterium]|nr:Uma2 family endonuclease [Oscillospiraceae bacterium]